MVGNPQDTSSIAITANPRSGQTRLLSPVVWVLLDGLSCAQNLPADSGLFVGEAAAYARCRFFIGE